MLHAATRSCNSQQFGSTRNKWTEERRHHPDNFKTILDLARSFFALLSMAPNSNMADNKTKLKVLLLLDLLSDDDEAEKQQRRRVNWVRLWIARREQRGAYHLLVRELALEDEAAYRDFFRMTKSQFRALVDRIARHIAKKDTVMRSSIKADERLAVTLRYLATGETFKSLEYNFRISRTTISYIVFECCSVLFKTLAPEFLKTPDSEEEWSLIAQNFSQHWNFPNGIGAIDGKRIIIQQPMNAGSHYFDYKDHHSIILLAVFGPNYECLWADIGTNGRAPDGAIWQRSDLKAMLGSKENKLHLPSMTPLPMRSKPVPFVLTGDDAFGLTTYLMKLYPRTHLTLEQRIFNYRLSQMRRISENGFGILANRWRVLRVPILLALDFVTNIVLALLVLHNYLR